MCASTQGTWLERHKKCLGIKVSSDEIEHLVTVNISKNPVTHLAFALSMQNDYLGVFKCHCTFVMLIRRHTPKLST